MFQKGSHIQKSSFFTKNPIYKYHQFEQNFLLLKFNFTNLNYTFRLKYLYIP